MSCCSDERYNKNGVKGVCEECGGETMDGESIEICFYSPEECKKCGWSPCDQSC